MKTTPRFKEIIEAHLKSVAKKDVLFAETLNKPNKNIDECINYILIEVQKIGAIGFADEEIFGMAIHYYDEDDIKNIKDVEANVIVNHSESKPIPKEIQKPKKIKESKKSKKEDVSSNYQVTIFDVI